MAHLEELTARENEWRARQPKHGFAEERHALYERIGMYQAWREIFREYVTLAREGNLEALKRVLFLYWYSLSEPFWLNGIPSLDEQLVREVLGMVDDLARKGELDRELAWMLPWYYHITSFHLDCHEGFDELKRASSRRWGLWRWRCWISSFENRGQLDEYWSSLCGSLTGNPPNPEEQQVRRSLLEDIQKELFDQDREGKP